MDRTIAGADRHLEDVERAVAVLLDPDLEPIVEMVLRAVDGCYEARAVDGWVRFARRADGYRWAYDVVAGEGRNPLGDQALDRFAPLADELANRFPDRTANAYPFAYEQVAQLFDHPSPPDVVAIHTASHHWAEQGGHIGEHGSLGAVQCRAPFLIAGKGVRALGRIDRPAQLIDIAPTVLALLGLEPGGGVGANGRARDDVFLIRQDGAAMLDLLDPAVLGDSTRAPGTVIGFLLDGTNANVLHDAIDRGEVPNIAGLAAAGTTLRTGIVSSLPTVTLPNHTTVLTGLHPGHHGVLHNAWWDRTAGEQVITNSASTWTTAMTSLVAGTDSIHGVIRRAQPSAFTASVNEPADPGASFSTFDLYRRGERGLGFPRTPDGLPHTTERFVRPFKDYGWYSQVDHHGVEQAVGILDGTWRGRDFPRPRFLWVNLTLTDSAFHEGGPHSEIARASLVDSDGRIGEVMAAVERAGIADDCAMFVCADHGMEESRPGVGGDWLPLLREAGLAVRDEAFGFLYVNAQG